MKKEMLSFTSDGGNAMPDHSEIPFCTKVLLAKMVNVSQYPGFEKMWINRISYSWLVGI